jgi:phosphate transport system substrate-binding protein
MKQVCVRFLGMLLACTAIAAHGQAIRVDSSSALLPLSQAIVEAFRPSLPGGQQVSLRESGTAEALRRLCAGEAELATVSRPILSAELARCGETGTAFIELPVAFDAIVVVVNPRNTFVASLSVPELRSIWEQGAQAKLRHWKDVNPGFPVLPLKLYAPDAKAESGGYFNEAVLGAGKEARRDVTTSVDDNLLARAIARDQGALGYVSLSHYAAHERRLKAVPIAAAAGAAAIAPTPENLASGAYQPLSRPLFLYVSVKALEKPAVGALADFYLRRGSVIARDLNYAPLTARSYQLTVERLQRRTAGSSWNGTVPVGLTVEALQRRLSAL